MNTAIILAAGAGEKMWPFNEYHAKASLPVGGEPNLLRFLRQIEKFHFENIYVVVHSFEQQLRYLLRDYENVQLIPVTETKGTNDSLESVIHKVQDEHILIAYGDLVVTDSVLKRVINTYRKESVDGVLLVDHLEGKRPQDWYCVQTDEQDNVTEIFGHPRPHYADYQMLGLFALQTEKIKQCIQHNPGILLNVNVGAMPPRTAEFEQSVQMLIDDGAKVKAVHSQGEAVDLDKPWHLLMANELIAEKEVAMLTESSIPKSATIHPSAEIRGTVVLGEHVTIGKNVIIEGNAIIGDHTTIENGALIGKNVIIGNHCQITDYCRIHPNSVIGNKNRMGHSAEFQGVTFDSVSFVHFGEVLGVIGSYTDLAAGITVGTLRFDDLKQTHRIQGRIEIPEKFDNAVFVGDYTRTGIHNLFMPGVKVGTNCAIGPGVLVQEDLPSETLILLEQQTIKKKWGSHKYGW